jgi:methylglutaconyl-CoA hydratase
MSTSTIRTAVSPRGVATVTLDRPESLNAFNQDMLEEMQAHLGRLAADPLVRVLVLRATGKHFSAGADMARPEHGGREVEHTGFIDLFVAFETFPRPTVAVVHGACVGGAAGLVACCDLVLATDGAFFSIPEVRIGVSPVGITPVLVRAMGLRNYRRHALTGDRFGAAQALGDGLVHAVHPAEEIDSALEATIDSLLLGAPGAQTSLKAHLRQAYPGLLDELAAAHRHHGSVDTFQTSEALEGVAAFMERRKPAWYPPR